MTPGARRKARGSTFPPGYGAHPDRNSRGTPNPGGVIRPKYLTQFLLRCAKLFEAPHSRGKPHPVDQVRREFPDTQVDQRTVRDENRSHYRSVEEGLVDEVEQVLHENSHADRPGISRVRSKRRL